MYADVMRQLDARRKEHRMKKAQTVSIQAVEVCVRCTFGMLTRVAKAVILPGNITGNYR